MVRKIEWIFNKHDSIPDRYVGRYMINTNKELNVLPYYLSIPNVEYNPCNVRLIAVAIKDILLLDIDDGSLTDMVSNIGIIINDDEYNYIYKEVKHIYSVELYSVLVVFKIYDKYY